VGLFMLLPQFFNNLKEIENMGNENIIKCGECKTEVLRARKVTISIKKIMRIRN
jgi:hypothetical protein